MRSLIQRVSQASVEVHGGIIAEISEGFLILFCAMKGDTNAKAELLAKKVANLRVFEDKNGNSTECESGTPRRLLYPELEKKTNANVPSGDSIFDRVENDPS